MADRDTELSDFLREWDIKPDRENVVRAAFDRGWSRCRDELRDSQKVERREAASKALTRREKRAYKKRVKKQETDEAKLRLVQEKTKLARQRRRAKDRKETKARRERSSRTRPEKLRDDLAEEVQRLPVDRAEPDRWTFRSVLIGLRDLWNIVGDGREI